MAARLHHAENGSDTSKNKERKIILAYGIAMGMLVGTVMGSVFDDIALWIPIGVMFGVVFGIICSDNSRKRKSDSQTPLKWFYEVE